MRILPTHIFILFFAHHIFSQTFYGSIGSINNNGTTTTFYNSVSGLNQNQLDSTYGLEEVHINIVHPKVEELFIYLQSPAGTTVELTQGISCKGSNYTNTHFTHAASTPITLSSAPFTGTFRPTGSLGRFQNGQQGNGTWKLLVHDYLAFVDTGSVLSWEIKFGNSPASSVKFTSSNLPIVVLNTGNQTLSDSDITASMGIIYNGNMGQRNYLTDPWNNYNGKVAIRFRGHSSRTFEKKPYALETVDAMGSKISVPILGMPAENDWNLIAMYQDKSLIRIPFTYNLAAQMGHYAPRSRNVELVVNGEYRGVYALMEKPKRDKFRIDVSSLAPTDNSFPDITGGYVVKIDRTDKSGWYSMLPGDQTNSHFYYQYVYPKDVDITVLQKSYIKSYMDSFETVMNSPFFADPLIGYQKYIDVNSFIDFFIINELSKNVDAYRLSTYLYKHNISRGGKLYIGPVWDYDLAWHNCDYGNAFDFNGWEYQLTDSVYPTPRWWSKFLQDSNFVNKLYCRWDQLRQNILDVNSLYAYIDATASELNESQQRNFKQWPILGTYIFPNPQNQTNATYQSEIADFKTWIANRITWVDGAITGNCNSLGIRDNSDNLLAIFPNPVESTSNFNLYLQDNSTVSLEIVNIEGIVISHPIHEHRAAGKFTITFDRKGLNSGIYFYRLKINNTLKTGKLLLL